MKPLGKVDRMVIEAFTDRQPAVGRKLSTDGRRLDGHWMGGGYLAYWDDQDLIVLPETGSRAGDAVQRAVRKVAPKSWLKHSYGGPPARR